MGPSPFFNAMFWISILLMTLIPWIGFYFAMDAIFNGLIQLVRIRATR